MKHIASPEVIAVGFLNRRQFDGLISLCEFLEESLSKESVKRQMEASQLGGQGSEEEQAFNSVEIDDHLFEVERDFPRTVRYSMLNTLMSTTESCLVRLCRVAQKERTITEAFDEKGGGLIQRAIIYLQDKANIDSTRMVHEKRLASNLSNVRNAVVHNDGCIDGRHDEQQIVAFVSQSTGQIRIEDKTIVLSERFISGHAHAMKNFVHTLYGKFRQSFRITTVA